MRRRTLLALAAGWLALWAGAPAAAGRPGPALPAAAPAGGAFGDRLVVEGALIRETRTLYAQGRVVLATARGAGPRLQALDELRGPRGRHIAIATPAPAAHAGAP